MKFRSPVFALKRFSKREVAVRLFITAWLIYALHFATNTVREIYPALSLGDHLSFDVSEYLGLHPDIFEIPGRGAFINNNPGASILGALPYALARPVIDPVVDYVQDLRARTNAQPPEYDTTYPMAKEFLRISFIQGYDVKFALSAGVMQVLLMAPVSALSVVLMFIILTALTGSQGKAAVLSLLYAFATPVFYRTAQLNHNLLEAHFAFFSFALLWRPWDKTEQRKPDYLLAGLLVGWTVVLDYSGAIAVLVLGAYAWLKQRQLPGAARFRTDLLAFAVGVGLSGLVLAVYQWLAFGNPFYPAQHYMPATTYSGYGYQGMDLPSLSLLFENAFGMRYGLFVSAPILLSALYVPAWFKKGGRIIPRLEAWTVFLFTAGFFLFTAANQFSRMQFNTGIRHVVPVVPFIFLIAAGALLRLPVGWFVLVAAATTYWSWCLAMYRDVEQGLGVFEALIHITTEGIRLPWLATLHRMGYLERLSPLPILLLSAIFLWIVWNSDVPGLKNIRHSLFESRGRVSEASK